MSVVPVGVARFTHFFRGPSFAGVSEPKKPTPALIKISNNPKIIPLLAIVPAPPSGVLEQFNFADSTIGIGNHLIEDCREAAKKFRDPGVVKQIGLVVYSACQLGWQLA